MICAASVEGRDNQPAAAAAASVDRAARALQGFKVRTTAGAALAQDDLMAKARQQFQPIPPSPPELPGNPATPRRLSLGRCSISSRRPIFIPERLWDLRQAVAVMGASQLGIQLTSDEEDKITAFLESLTGEQPKMLATSDAPGARSRALSASCKQRSRVLVTVDRARNARGAQTFLAAQESRRNPQAPNRRRA
jgi:hypothetical protein